MLILLVACTGPDREPREASPLFGVSETETWRIPGLTAPAYVIRTESDVPHVYAADDVDLARVEGFEVARDRFFVMDLARRLAEGRVAALLGDLALTTDEQSRAQGMTYVTDLLDIGLTDATAARVEAYADGVNAYIEAVRAGQLPPPSEYEIAAPLLGAQEPVELMEPFTRRDVAAIGATLTYNLGYETGDVGNQIAWDEIPGRFDGQALADLRNAGLTTDIWDDDAPVFPIASANGWQTETGSDVQARERGRRTRPLPQSIVDRQTRRLPQIEKRLGHDHALGWGSNAWAVAASATTDGRALVCGDGHLPLSIPSLFYQIGLDTSVLGDGDTHQMGLVFPGMPVMAVGTNGQVGWSQTQLMGDITDWYREELQLDANGRPTGSLFEGGFRPLIAVDETYEVRDVPFFGSVGRTETWTRWQTFDGRWITDIEGRTATIDETLGAGETLVNLGGDFVVPGDTDGDGVITAISFDYTGFDRGNLLEASDHFGHAHDVHEFREATKRLSAYSQNIAVADSNGDILYTGWQPVPCRDYLDRESDGHWSEGSNPSLLLDGTRYGGFTIPFVDGVVDETQTDPYQCVVPFDVYPQSISPDRGYVLTANNDPGGHSLDGKLWNDPWYIGGPWIEGYRADTINTGLADLASTHSADLDSMQALQASTRSRTGEQWVPMLLASIDAARSASGIL